MIQRGHDPGAGLWSIPGGRIEPGETDAQALVREMLEETNLQVKVGRLIGSVQRQGPGGTGHRHQGLRGHGHRRDAARGRRRGRRALGDGGRTGPHGGHGGPDRGLDRMGSSRQLKACFSDSHDMANNSVSTASGLAIGAPVTPCASGRESCVTPANRRWPDGGRCARRPPGPAAGLLIPGVARLLPDGCQRATCRAHPRSGSLPGRHPRPAPATSGGRGGRGGLGGLGGAGGLGAAEIRRDRTGTGPMVHRAGSIRPDGPSSRQEPARYSMGAAGGWCDDPGCRIRRAVLSRH